MEKDKKYFEEQIKGLILILDHSQDSFIHRDYVKEKLNMALTCGIGFDWTIKAELERLRKKSEGLI